MNESNNRNIFTDVSDDQWNDWRWQFRNRLQNLDELKRYFRLSPAEEEGVEKCLQSLRMAVTPYYLSLIDHDNPDDPIRKQCIPTVRELYAAKADLLDPLHEIVDSPVPHLTHRHIKENQDKNVKNASSAPYRH